MSVFRSPLYIVTPHATLSYNNARLKVSYKNKSAETYDFPLRKISSINIYSAVNITPFTLEALLRLAVPCHFFSYYGRFIGRICPVNGKDEQNILILNKIVSKPSLVNSLAAYFIGTKITAMIKLYQQILKNNTTENSELVKRQIEQAQLALIKLKSDNCQLATTLGIEGALTKSHFQIISSSLRKEQALFKVASRTRRPPKDPFNALLSFLYSLLLGEVLATLYNYKMPVSIGLIHSAIHKYKPAFALDFMEQFRVLIADRLAMRLINLEQIKMQDFVQIKNAVYLNESGRKTVALEWLNYLKTPNKLGRTARDKIGLAALEFKRLLKSY